MNELNTRMIDHLRASKLACSTKLLGERDSGRGAEYVGDGSVAMRSGTVGYSRDRLEFGFGFGPKETDHPEDLELSGTGCSPNRPLKGTNPFTFQKKTLQDSPELALFRRLPTAYFGLVQSQETLENEVRGAQATRETKRKLNPFLRKEECEREASASRKMLSKGIMPWERMRGLALPKPLTLEQCVTLLMSPPGVIQDPIFYKTDTHPCNASSNSDPSKPHATLHDRLIRSASTSTHFDPFECREMPDKSGADPFFKSRLVAR